MLQIQLPDLENFEMAVSEERRQRILGIKAEAERLFGDDSICDCESLARLCYWLINISPYQDAYIGTWNNDEEAFVEDIGYVLCEINPSWPIPGRRSDDRDLMLKPGYAGSSCFLPYLKDTSNQVRHFWAYVQAGYQFRATIFGFTAAAVREESMADFELGMIGSAMGAGLDWHPYDAVGMGLSLEDVPNYIRQHLCGFRERPGSPPTYVPTEED